MPATIVETNTKKFKRKDIDPITLDIIENAMMNARYEMDAVVFRTAMSHTFATPFITPIEESAGVLGTFAVWMDPDFSSTRIRSVNVPPTSTPRR